ncbi:succinylglutamate desuccinylase [halophilic archaeon]|nr:succinylglutamate desuccinylase [halophilic archaeon]
MQTETVGDGTPDLAVVACLHGDEQCGKSAIGNLLAERPVLDRAVQFVVANEAAIAANVRFVDEDLNRAFPGNPDGDTYESRLAAELLAELRDRRVLDLHSTHSHPVPFALVDGLDETRRNLVRATGLDRVVDIGHIPGGLISHVAGVAVECGYVGTATAERNAERVLRNFLGATGALDVPFDESDPEVYRVMGVAAGREYEFVGRNFERVEAGETFASRDGDELQADEPFYPVLMSTEGYDEMVGFCAERLGRLSEVS